MDEGEWRIMSRKKRSIGQRLRAPGKIAAKDKMVRTIEDSLRGTTVREMHREELKTANCVFKYQDSLIPR